MQILFNAISLQNQTSVLKKKNSLASKPSFGARLKNETPVKSINFAHLAGYISFKRQMYAPYNLALKDTWGDPPFWLGKDAKAIYFADQAIERLADKHIYNDVQKNKPPLKNGDAVWSVTAEYKPIQAGGLGVVPVDIQNNFTREGIKTPTFLPLYHDGSSAVFTPEEKDNNKATLAYKNNTFNLEKVVSFNTNAVVNQSDTNETVDIYKTIVNGQDLYLVSNMDYTFAPIYGNTVSDLSSKAVKAREKERFAFFAKAVHILAEAKVDDNVAKNFNYINKDLFKNLPEPDGFLLNDWHAGALAPLLRYKTVAQNLYGDISDAAADKLINSRIITIVHNAGYQGQVWDKKETENILNTLFDQYAKRIVTHAKMYINGAENLENPLVLGYANDHDEKHLSLLNMGASLSDYVVPVSKQYAKELCSDPDVVGAKWLKELFKIRMQYGTMIGINNGNDKINHIPSVQNISINASKLADKNYTPQFVPYCLEDGKDLFAKKLKNKEELFKNLIPHCLMNDKNKKYNFVYSDKEGCGQAERTIDLLKNTDFSKTPVFTFVGRMASQKGIETIHGSVIGLFTDILEQRKKALEQGKAFNYELPVFLIAGPDEEGGKFYKELQDLKRALTDLSEKYNVDLSSRVIAQSSFAPSFIYILGSDYLMAPSNFEPYGLVQSEAQAKGVVPVTSGLGGFINTIYDPDFNYHLDQSSEVIKTHIMAHKGQTGYLAERFGNDLSIGRKVYCYKNALKHAYTDFSVRKKKTKEIVVNTMKLDHSWIATGVAYEYLHMFGYHPDEGASELREQFDHQAL